MNYESPIVEQKLSGDFGCRHCGLPFAAHTGSRWECPLRPVTFGEVCMGETFSYQRGLMKERYMKLAHGLARQQTGYMTGEYVELASSTIVEVK